MEFIMSKLKELTLENHKKAERSEFARKLLKGLSPEEYHQYLSNQLLIYHYLETTANQIFLKFPALARCEKIRNDIEELKIEYALFNEPVKICPVVFDYKTHISTLTNDGLLAHVYVRHFGDMYGGQIIKKRVPGSGTMYDFNDVETLKNDIRSLLNDNLADEANLCFEFAIKLFEELDEYNLG
jgi:heme oxygenase